MPSLHSLAAFMFSVSVIRYITNVLHNFYLSLSLTVFCVAMLQLLRDGFFSHQFAECPTQVVDKVQTTEHCGNNSTFTS